MATYKMYHMHNPSDFIMIENDGFFPMEIKSKAIKASTRFTFTDWTSLRIRSDRK